jgi:glutaminyl-peptide cyclotransferase
MFKDFTFFCSNPKVFMKFVASLSNLKNMKRTCLQKNTTCSDSSGIEDQRKLNTNEQNTCEFHLDDLLFNDLIFDPKVIQHVKRFVQMKVFTLVISLLVVSFCSCAPKPSRKPVTNFEISATNNQVRFGSVVSVTLQTKTFNNKLKETNIYLNDSLLHTINQENYSFNIEPDLLKPGQQILKAVSINDRNTEGIASKTFTVVSDLAPKQLTYKIHQILPHNQTYFTQGFEFHQGILYEGTGEYGTSGIFAYKPGSNKVIKELKLDNQYFGEGITILNDKIYQLTYKEKTGFVYDLKTFEKIDQFTFQSDEGWGLTNDGKYLIMSDGTSLIHYIDPSNYSRVKSIEVTNHLGVVNMLNELEYVDGYIYANIWTTEFIVKFDTSDGRVVAEINMKGLRSAMNNERMDVLNGIAFNRDENMFYLTGKLWPNMYKVQFVEK